MIEFINIYKSYGNRRVLENISFQLENTGVVGLLGNNGEGKTTLLKLITGFHCPTQGEVKINGFTTCRDLPKALDFLGYLPESSPLYPGLTVRQCLAFSYKIKTGRSDFESSAGNIIRKLNLKDVENTKVELLSHGYRQRTALGMSLINNPKILVLDEPINGLDPRQIVETRNLITEYGKDNLVIFSTHNIHEVILSCSRVLILHKGSVIVSGTPEELLERYKKDSLEEVFIECTKN